MGEIERQDYEHRLAELKEWILFLISICVGLFLAMIIFASLFAWAWSQWTGIS